MLLRLGWPKASLGKCDTDQEEIEHSYLNAFIFDLI